MLKFIREKNQNFVIKIFLGLVMFAFAAFFGLSGMMNKSIRNGVASNAPAVVNGHEISAKQFQYMYNNQIEKLQTMFKDKLPQEYLEGTKKGILNNLINTELLSEELEKLGFQTSNKEMADSVKKMPQFNKDGNFDFVHYKSYLENYLYATGSPFEHDLMQELTTNAFTDTLDNILTPTPDELKQLNQIMNETYKFSVIKVPKDADKTPAVDTKTGTNTDNTKSDVKLETKDSDPAQAQKLATDLLAQWQSGKDLKTELSQNKLSQADTQPLAPGSIKSIFGGKGDIAHLKELLALTASKPFITAPIDEGRYYYLVKLVEAKTPSSDLDKDSEAKLRDAYTKNISSGLEEALIGALHQTAKIKIAADLKSDLK